MQAGQLSISQLLSAGFESFKKNLNSVVTLFVGLEAIIFLLTYLLKAPFLNILMIPVVILMHIAILKTHKTPIEKFDYEKILDLKDPGLKQKFLDLLWTYVIYAVLITLLFILLIIPGVIFMVYWYFFAYIVLDQRIRGMAALKRSKEMLTGRWWKTFGLVAISAVLSVVLSFIVTSIGGRDALVGGFLMSVISGILSIYFGYVVVAYYFDLKK